MFVLVRWFGTSLCKEIVIFSLAISITTHCFGYQIILIVLFTFSGNAGLKRKGHDKAQEADEPNTKQTRR